MAAPKYLHLSLCLSSALLALSPNAAQACATLSLDSRASLANDLRFLSADDQSPILPPTIITKKYRSVYVPLDLLAVAALAGALLMARRRKND